MDNWRKYIAEFLGTFFLVLTVGCTVLPGVLELKMGKGVVAPLAIGSMLMVMVYATGHISGGHLNPAVTLAVAMRGKCRWADVPFYMIAQVLGGLLAAFASMMVLVGAWPDPVPPLGNAPAAFLAEFLFTLALCYVVLSTATAVETAGNSYFGLAIGFTVLAGAFAAGGISGAAFNPAVALGAALMRLLPWGQVWIHLVAELLGGAAAAGLFLLLCPQDRTEARPWLSRITGTPLPPIGAAADGDPARPVAESPAQGG